VEYGFVGVGQSPQERAPCLEANENGIPEGAAGRRVLGRKLIPSRITPFVLRERPRGEREEGAARKKNWGLEKDNNHLQKIATGMPGLPKEKTGRCAPRKEDSISWEKKERCS